MRTQQILGDNLLGILRREQRQLRDDAVTVPLVRPEQVPQSLLLEPVTEDLPSRLSLFLGQGRSSAAAKLVTELLPVGEPRRRLVLVG